MNKRNAIMKQAEANGLEIIQWNREGVDTSASLQRYTISASAGYLMKKHGTLLYAVRDDDIEMHVQVDMQRDQASGNKHVPLFRKKMSVFI